MWYIGQRERSPTVTFPVSGGEQRHQALACLLCVQQAVWHEERHQHRRQHQHQHQQQMMNNVKQEAVTMALENLAWCTERLRRTGQFGWCLLSDWTSHGRFQHKNEFVCHGSATFWEWDDIKWTMSTLSSSMVILIRTTSYLMCKL